MKSTLFLFIIFCFLSSNLEAQVGIGDNSNPNQNAVLDINSNSKGVLFPRLFNGTLNSYENTLGPNDLGMFVYNTTNQQYMYYKSPEAGFVNIANVLIDADNDTYLKVDEMPDDDNITIQTASTTALTIETNDYGIPIFNTRNTSANSGNVAGSLLFANQLPTGSGGTNNTYFGNRDSIIEIKGYQNSAFGYNSLNINNNGAANTAIGFNAMRNNDSGFNNVALGGQSMQNNVSGVANTALGEGTLDSLISGSGNVAVGHGTMRKLSSSNYNSALGTSALQKLKTGINNVGFGAFSMNNLKQGDNNVSIGYYSGFGTSLNNRSKNVFIGSYSGQNNNGDGNVFIGYNAGKSLDASNKLIISTTAANYSLIYGDFGTGDLGVFWDYNTPLPARFSVNGDVYIKDALQLEPKAFAPTCNVDKEGLLYYNGTTHKLNLCDGTTWVPLN